MSYKRVIDDIRHGRADRRTVGKAMASLGLAVAATPVPSVGCWMRSPAT